VVASEKGVVVGRLQFQEDGDPIDCTRMGVGGKAIPPNVDKVGRTCASLHPKPPCISHPCSLRFSTGHAVHHFGAALLTCTGVKHHI
jgi:hypothetical protein